MLRHVIKFARGESFSVELTARTVAIVIALAIPLSACSEGERKYGATVLASNGSGFLVAGEYIDTVDGTPGRVRLFPVSAEGILGAEGSGGLTGDPIDQIALVPIGDAYLLAWDSSKQPGEVGFRVVDANGEAIGPVQNIPSTAAYNFYLNVVSGKTEALILWSAAASTVADETLLTARVSLSGTILDASPIKMANGVCSRCVIGGIDEGFVAWDATSGKTVMQRLDDNLQPLGAPITLMTDGHCNQPTITTVGHEYVVICGGEPLEVQRITSDGQVLDASPQNLAVVGESDFVAGSPDGRMALVQNGWSESSGGLPQIEAWVADVGMSSMVVGPLRLDMDDSEEDKGAGGVAFAGSFLAMWQEGSLYSRGGGSFATYLARFSADAQLLTPAFVLPE